MKTFELRPIDGRKSFYGKCFVQEQDGIATLYSYNTEIATICGGVYTLIYDKPISMTTNRHIKAFKALYGLA